MSLHELSHIHGVKRVLDTYMLEVLMLVVAPIQNRKEHAKQPALRESVDRTEPMNYPLLNCTPHPFSSIAVMNVTVPGVCHLAQAHENDPQGLTD